MSYLWMQFQHLLMQLSTNLTALWTAKCRGCKSRLLGKCLALLFVIVLYMTGLLTA